MERSLLWICAAMCFAAEPLCFWLWRRKTRAGIIPFAVGIIVYMVVSFLRAPVRALIPHNSFYYLAAGLLTAVLEECGRCFAFNRLISSREGRVSTVSYGIGHSLLEDLSQGFILADMISRITSEHITLTYSGGLLYMLTTLLGICCGIGFHISMSIAAFYAVMREKVRVMLPAAIVIHTLLDQPFLHDNIEMAVAVTAVLCFLAYRIYAEMAENTE